MDLLEQLEQRIDMLLERNQSLSEQLAALARDHDQERTQLTHLEEENRQLRQALAAERSAREAVLRRIDALVQKCKQGLHDS